jgi:hypothetical protein
MFLRNFGSLSLDYKALYAITDVRTSNREHRRRRVFSSNLRRSGSHGVKPSSRPFVDLFCLNLRKEEK